MLPGSCCLTPKFKTCTSGPSRTCNVFVQRCSFWTATVVIFIFSARRYRTSLDKSCWHSCRPAEMISRHISSHTSLVTKGEYSLPAPPHPHPLYTRWPSSAIFYILEIAIIRPYIDLHVVRRQQKTDWVPCCWGPARVLYPLCKHKKARHDKNTRKHRIQTRQTTWRSYM